MVSNGDNSLVVEGTNIAKPEKKMVETNFLASLDVYFLQIFFHNHSIDSNKEL